MTTGNNFANSNTGATDTQTAQGSNPADAAALISDPPQETSAAVPTDPMVQNVADSRIAPPHRVLDPAPGEEAWPEPGAGYKPLHPHQLHAIDLVVEGRSDSEIADILGYHRNTICRWRLYHPCFRAELSRRRHAIWFTLGDRFRCAAQQALSILSRELSSSNPHVAVRAATALLRIASNTRARNLVPPDEPTHPTAVLDHQFRLDRKASGADKADHDTYVYDMDRQQLYQTLIRLAYSHPETPDQNLMPHTVKDNTINPMSRRPDMSYHPPPEPLPPDTPFLLGVAHPPC